MNLFTSDVKKIIYNFICLINIDIYLQSAYLKNVADPMLQIGNANKS